MSKIQIVPYGIAENGNSTLLPQEVLDRLGLKSIRSDDHSSGNQGYTVEYIGGYFKVTDPARQVLKLLGYGTALDRAWNGSDGFIDIYIAKEDMMYVKYEPREPFKDRWTGEHWIDITANGLIDITEKGWEVLREYDFEVLRNKVQDSMKTVDNEKLIDIARILGINYSNVR